MRDPRRSLPVAIVGTQGAVVLIFALMALSLVGLQPAAQISAAAPFSAALAAAGFRHARQLVGAGVVLSVGASVLVGAQGVARQALGLARAGLLPAPLARVSGRAGAPWAAALVTGAPTGEARVGAAFRPLCLRRIPLPTRAASGNRHLAAVWLLGWCSPLTCVLMQRGSASPPAG
jgi:L-asparagine transporter-like permease